MEAEIRQAIGSQVEVTLIPGSGGVFEVLCDDRLVFSKKEKNRFPDPGEVVKLLQSTPG
ncbi:MAG: hypothetical protein CSA32_03155 [Desulfobulbus propionicus]|nr:MAG: hypothetical protein CSA32_03155 [Desulfobulbus propionicus]